MHFSVMLPYLSIIDIIIYSVLKNVTTVYDRYLKQNFVKDYETHINEKKYETDFSLKVHNTFPKNVFRCFDRS